MMSTCSDITGIITTGSYNLSNDLASFARRLDDPPSADYTRNKTHYTWIIPASFLWNGLNVILAPIMALVNLIAGVIFTLIGCYSSRYRSITNQFFSDSLLCITERLISSLARTVFPCCEEFRCVRECLYPILPRQYIDIHFHPSARVSTLDANTMDWDGTNLWEHVRDQLPAALESLGEHPHQRSRLRLRGRGFNDAAAIELISLLSTNPHVNDLEIINGSLGSAGREAIASAILANLALQSLTLSMPILDTEAIEEIIRLLADKQILISFGNSPVDIRTLVTILLGLNRPMAIATDYLSIERGPTILWRSLGTHRKRSQIVADLIEEFPQITDPILLSLRNQISQLRDKERTISSGRFANTLLVNRDESVDQASSLPGSSDATASQIEFSSISSSSVFDYLCNEPYNFYKEIKKAIKDKIDVPFCHFFIFLKLCPCMKVNNELRIKLENDSIKLLEQIHPSKENTINVVSVGAGGLYQELVYLAKLAKAGYTQIRLIAIDPLPIYIGSLDMACHELIPAKITIDDQYNSLNDYIQKANEDENLLPDLLLLIDLTDDKYKVESQLLSDYSFDQLLHHNLLKNGTVVSHSVITYIRDRTSTVVDFIPNVFSGIVTPQAKSLSSLQNWT